jgi:plasmid stabilization system protein ParE
VVFKEAEGRSIDVLRLLHDSMDLARHVPVAGR